MDESKGLSKEDTKLKSFNSTKNKGKSKNEKNVSSGQEVLLKLPGGFEYKAPGKRQRIIIASIVLGLNVLLLVAVGLYFYLPGFKEIIYNIGR